MAEQVHRDKSQRLKGLIMVLTGATFWGLSGTAAQYLFQKSGFTPEWMVSVRMFISGMILLLISSMNKNKIFDVWKGWRNAGAIFLFGSIGMLGVQYTYFASIATGNAATATLLQYLAPVFVVVYFIIKNRERPTLQKMAAVALALLGTFLLITNGKVSALSVPGISVFWGILSGLSLAFYTLFSAELLKKWTSILVTGWGMVVGSMVMAFIHPPWVVEGQIWNAFSAMLLLFVIVFGTLLAFYLYIESIRLLNPTESSLLSSVEPLSAALASVIFLNIPFGYVQGIGGLCIIGTVAILSIQGKTQKSISIEG